VLMSIKYVLQFSNGIRIASVIYYWSADSSYLFTCRFLESRQGKWNSNVDININLRSTAYLTVSIYVVMLIVTEETRYVWLHSSLV
jgi:hypothetical protein